MPYIKFDAVSSKNSGSANGFLEYMGKEDLIKGMDKEFWFNERQDFIPDYKVLENIDYDQKGIAKGDYRYYTGSLNFSESELKFLNKDEKQLKKYSRAVFEIYAENFNKGLSSSDVRWFAKLESDRYYKGTDDEVKKGKVKSGDKKPGINTHLHFIVGRKTADNKRKISPITKHIQTNDGAVKGGFSRDMFKHKIEQEFDHMFTYNRPIEESYRYLNNMSKNDSRSVRNQAISNVSAKSKSTLKYDLLSDNEKHKKLEVLMNYIQYGGAKNNRLQLDVNEIFTAAKKNCYNGNVYKSLLNLNYKLKDGFDPANENMTAYVLNYARFINSTYKELPDNLKEDRLYRFALLVNKRLPDNNKLKIQEIMNYEQANKYNGSAFYGLKSLSGLILAGKEVSSDSTRYVLHHDKRTEILSTKMGVNEDEMANNESTIDLNKLSSYLDSGSLNISNGGSGYIEEPPKKRKIKRGRRI